MAGKILDHYDGVVEKFHKGHHRDKKFIISREQDVQPILDMNKKQLSESSEDWKGDMHKVASVPLILIDEWSKEIGDYILKPQHRPKLFAKLNDPAYAHLRTKKGRI